ncbi:endonuclease domain-containing protein [Pseudonocardia sp. DSM 110487]|uniref:endonuclease domain-containing protein n=1 Tax=Pseudonocardia sp. DSM 110487 TaxID=2865833 RepID=UPI001C69EF2E|nr:endonuclease domain-containing protein [Pseudonocardia sp. DSM 110487]QYN37073.1 endonuclease domain-containing protein [Pseudonocardia sp. DSM 110487]
MAVTGLAAAHWHGMLDAAPALVEITVPRTTHRSAPPGVVMHRSDLHAIDLVEHRDLLVVDGPLAALQAAVALPDGSAFLDRALQKHVPFLGLYDSYCRNLGRRGWKQASRLITAAADRADSAAERVLKRLLREAGITGWVLGHRFGPHMIDLAFPDKRVAIEVDGWAWHVDVDRFRADRRKATHSPAQAGPSCGSPGTTWSPGQARSSRRSSTPSPRPDRREWCGSDRSVAPTPFLAISA